MLAKITSMKVFKQVKELVEGRGGTIFSYLRTTREIVRDVGRPELQPRMGRCSAMHEPCRPWDRAGDPSGGRACVQKYITKIILLDNNKCSMLALIPVRNTSSFLKLDIK